MGKSNIFGPNIEKDLSHCYDDNSPCAIISRIDPGQIVLNEKHLTLTGSPVSINVYNICKQVKITTLYGYVLDNTDISDLVDIYFDIWDGSISIPLTKTSGSSITGFDKEGIFIKDGLSSDNLVCLNSDQCQMYESASKKIAQPFICVPKYGTNTYIRFNYTCTTSIDVKLRFGAGYATPNIKCCIGAE